MLRFIQLTDCHLRQNPTESGKQTSTLDSLRRVIKDIKENQSPFDFVVVTGDISQAGTTTSYHDFLQIIHSLDKPFYCLPGNHDDAALLNTLVPSSPNTQISSQQINDHLLILLNSQHLEKESGIISASNLAELKTTLDNNTLPVIIALHHQPINIQSPWLDKIGLDNKNELISLLEKYTLVKLLLFGHVHQPIDTMHQHIRLLGTPSTGYQFTPKTQQMQLDTQTPGYRMIQLASADTDSILTHVHRISHVKQQPC